MSAPRTLQAELFTRLPERLHYRGAPTAWVKMTRPGHSLHSFLEGLQFDATGTAWLCDVPYGRIFQVTPDGQWATHHHYDGEPHSLRSVGGGGGDSSSGSGVGDGVTHYIADHRHGLLTLDSHARLDTLVGAQTFKGLSDLTLAPNGALWLTDSGRSSLADASGGLYRYRPDGTLDHILANIPYPNGVAVSKCGTFVYIAVTRANAIWRLFADAPDSGAPMVGVHIQLSGGLGPDGLAINRAGHLAVAQAQAGRAYIYDAIGDQLAQVNLPRGLWTTSVAFHPAHENELYIVEAQHGAIYKVDLTTVTTTDSTTINSSGDDA